MKANYNLTLMQRHNIRKQCEALADERIAAVEDEISWAMDVTILYALHRYPGTAWGAERCRRFYRYMMQVHQDLRMRYGMQDDPNSAIWAAARDLKEIGIDVTQMRREAIDEEIVLKDIGNKKRCPDCSCILDSAQMWNFCPHCGKSIKK